jgi:hypothetical protein
MYYFLFYGLRYDSGISEIIENDFEKNDLYDANSSNYVLRLILDVGFHVFVKGIWLTLMSATFILTYFELRESTEKTQYDEANICYICHLDRDAFFKYKISFDKHVKKIHNLKYYIYFIMYIVTKNPHNLSKLEKYVLDKYRTSDLNWIPSRDTIALQEQVTKIRENKLVITTEFN